MIDAVCHKAPVFDPALLEWTQKIAGENYSRAFRQGNAERRL